MLKKTVLQGRSERTTKPWTMNAERRSEHGSLLIIHRSPFNVFRLADFFSSLLFLLLRLLMCPCQRSGRIGKVGLPESQDQMRVLEPQFPE